jgi:hypothetical protein
MSIIMSGTSSEAVNQERAVATDNTDKSVLRRPPRRLLLATAAQLRAALATPGIIVAGTAAQRARLRMLAQSGQGLTVDDIAANTFIGTREQWFALNICRELEARRIAATQLGPLFHALEDRRALAEALVVLERHGRVTLHTDLVRWTFRRRRGSWLISLEIDGITVERWGLWELPDDPDVLSLSEVRAALGPDAARPSNAELREMRDQADRLLKVFSDSRWLTAAPFDRRLLESPEDHREAIEERAAILQFEGGFDQADAEGIAFECYIQSRRTVH